MSMQPRGPMNILILPVGAPASGKTTALRGVGLAHLAIDMDALRLMWSAPDGQSISQASNARVHRTATLMLEQRMERGQTTIVDASHASKGSLAEYKPFLKRFGYTAYGLDFRHVPLETCLARNRLRPVLRRVPEEVLIAKWKYTQRMQWPPWLVSTTAEDMCVMVRAHGGYVEDAV